MIDLESTTTSLWVQFKYIDDEKQEEEGSISSSSSSSASSTPKNEAFKYPTTTTVALSSNAIGPSSVSWLFSLARKHNQNKWIIRKSLQHNRNHRNDDDSLTSPASNRSLPEEKDTTTGTGKRHVGFSSTTPETFHHYYSKKEIQKSWYTSQDYVTFMQECQWTVETLMNNNSNNNNRVDSRELCTRGLEPYFANACFQDMHVRRETIVKAILQAQVVNQISWTPSNPHSLRELSESISSKAIPLALALAEKDHKEVESFFASEQS